MLAREGLQTREQQGLEQMISYYGEESLDIGRLTVKRRIEILEGDPFFRSGWLIPEPGDFSSPK